MSSSCLDSRETCAPVDNHRVQDEDRDKQNKRETQASERLPLTPTNRRVVFPSRQSLISLNSLLDSSGKFTHVRRFICIKSVGGSIGGQSGSIESAADKSNNLNLNGGHRVSLQHRALGSETKTMPTPLASSLWLGGGSDRGRSICIGVCRPFGQLSSHRSRLVAVALVATATATTGRQRSASLARNGRPVYDERAAR